MSKPRAALVFVSGTLVGAALVTFIHIHFARSRLAIAPDVPAGGATPIQIEQVPADSLLSGHPVGFSQGFAQLQAVSQIGDADALEARLRRLLGNRSPSSSSELAFLFGRLFEIDTHRALDIVLSAGLPHEQLSQIFRAWAEIDFAESMSLLRDVHDPWAERLFAYELLEASGNDLGLIERLVAEAESLDQTELQTAALVQRAEYDLSSAVGGVIQIAGVDAKVLAMVQIARVAARNDVNTAVEVASTISEEDLRYAFMVELYQEWSSRDLVGFLGHLGTLDQNRPGIRGEVQRALAIGAESDPRRTIEFGESVGGQIGLTALGEGLKALAADDPLAALGYLDTASLDGRNRERFLRSVAAGYVSKDSESAISWVSGLSPPSDAAWQAVLEGVAGNDLARAIDLELGRPATPGVAFRPPGGWISIPMLSDLLDPEAIASEVLASDAGQHAEGILSAIIARWATMDPYGALSWLQANSETVSAAVNRSAASALIESSDFEQVIQMADLLDPGVRSQWIETVIGKTSVHDPLKALAIAERYQSEPFFQSAIANIARSTIARDGPVAALALIGDFAGERTTVLVATRWAEINPTDAAEWAAGLVNADDRDVALDAVLDAWVIRDQEGAMNWVEQLTDTKLRDRAALRICEISVRRCG